MKQLLSHLILLFATTSPAWGDMVTIKCDDPQGHNLFHGQNALSERFERDLVTHSKHFGGSPTFIFDPSRPKELLVLWGSGVDGLGLTERQIGSFSLGAKTKRANVVFRSDVQITAVRPYTGGVEMFSLYPGLGYGVFTNHSHSGLEEQVMAWQYYGKCDFVE